MMNCQHTPCFGKKTFSISYLKIERPLPILEPTETKLTAQILTSLIMPGLNLDVQQGSTNQVGKAIDYALHKFGLYERVAKRKPILDQIAHKYFIFLLSHLEDTVFRDAFPQTKLSLSFLQRKMGNSFSYIPPKDLQLQLRSKGVLQSVVKKWKPFLEFTQKLSFKQGNFFNSTYQLCSILSL